MWRGDSSPGDLALKALAHPAALLFGGAVAVRSKAYDAGLLRARKGGLPVVSVGNLAVGGTGKTPVSSWLLRQLSERGWRPALISRGYGEDEVQLHRRWRPDSPTIIARHRIDGVREARELGCDLAILDDGYQHRALHRDFDLLLLSPAHRFPKSLLPAGPFREGAGAMRRAHHVLVTAKGAQEIEAARDLLERIQGVASAPDADLFPLQYGEWEDADGVTATLPPGSPLVVTSVAEPDAFVQEVRRRTGEVRGHLAYPDHHAFVDADVRGILRESRGGWVATTEKDSVKLVAFRELLPELRVLPLIAAPEPEVAERLLNRIEGRCREVKEG